MAHIFAIHRSSDISLRDYKANFRTIIVEKLTHNQRLKNKVNDFCVKNMSYNQD